MSRPPEAFLLLTLLNVTLKAGSHIHTGTLGLECITISGFDRNVFLVLRLNELEIPIDHSRSISFDASIPDTRTYTFHPTESDPMTLVLSARTSWHPNYMEDLDTFEAILSQYAEFFHTSNIATTPAYVSHIDEHASKDLADYRGHLVLVNEDNGEVMGEFDKKMSVREDPIMWERGHEKDPVVIEVPEGQAVDDEHPLQFFARAIPPDQQDWITKSAVIVSHAITHTTSLFLTVVNSASNYYINHSPPSPNHPANAKPGEPPKPPPRALVFLTSDKTKKGLAAAHTYTGQAVKVSSKTLSIIEGMIKKTMGSEKKGKGKGNASHPSIPGSGSLSPNSGYASRSSSPGMPSTPPPPYYASNSGHLLPDGKPPLPPRRSPSPSMSRSSSPQPPAPPLPPRRTRRLLLSANLILSTLDNSAKRILDVGTERIGAVVGHKYGEDAGQTSQLMAGTARNCALVYVDMRGMGRKAILKTARKEFIKGRVRSSAKE
ncbi:uncharacterized protein BT62DRAFT_879811 [Guyanagaster necrorhizus]|uniref:Senescence domain-containing protein n=1 Tax=Guyanagaster necrorhizus TaxID=856835 RepID=A0A9P8AYW1_9AGAR|nr:uncharacterized protein BT62DRAFT_879811 [Guyanagaster necrorhizus MCA 3950]KAG7453063.1 hypothetical protein BT62DRAFT_879811 [Guyanagaster necrorhizus MCA 3950]